MSERLMASKRIRKSFGKIGKIVDIPDLIGMQRDSFARFLQIDIPHEKREEVGLQAVSSPYSPSRTSPAAPRWSSCPTASGRSNTRSRNASTGG